MVIFRSPDGKPGYHQAETLDEAVGFVERLRNDDEVTDARVFRMDEVPTDAAPEAAAEPPPEPFVGEPVMADAGPNGRFGLFTR